MKKIVQKLTALILATTISLTGCSSKNSKTSNPESDSKSNTPSSVDFTTPEEYTTPIIESKTENLSSYYDFFDTYDVEYFYEEHLTNDTDLQEFQTIIDSYQECDFYYDGSITDLYNQIYQNSQEYVIEHPELINPLDEEYMYKLSQENTFYNINIADVMLTIQYNVQKTIKNVLTTKSDKANLEDIHRMLDLKIVLDTTYYPDINNENATITTGEYKKEENTITIYFYSLFSILDETDWEFKMFDIYNQSFLDSNYDSKIQNTINQVWNHEFNHMRQQICPDRIEKGQLNQNISYDPEVVTALLESSAETANYKDNYYYYDMSTYGYSYPQLRMFEAELLMLTITDNETDLDTFYQSIFNTDINKMLEYFNITSNEGKKTFLNILMAYDALDMRNLLSFEILQADPEAGIKGIDVINAIGYNYKLDIMRLAFKNIIDYGINNDNLTLEEYIILRNIIMYQISSDSEIPQINPSYQEEDLTFDFAESFSFQFWELINQFNAFLKSKFSVTDNDLEQFMNFENEYYAYSNIKNFTGSKTFKKLITKFPKLNLIIFNCHFISDSSYQKIKNKK